MMSVLIGRIRTLARQVGWLAILIFAFALTPAVAKADTFHAVNNGDWASPGTWFNETVSKTASVSPGAADTAKIDGGLLGVPASLTVNITAVTAIGTLTVGPAAGYAGTVNVVSQLTLNSGSLAVGTALSINSASSIFSAFDQGVLDLNGQTATISGPTTFAGNPNAPATLKDSAGTGTFHILATTSAFGGANTSITVGNLSIDAATTLKGGASVNSTLTVSGGISFDINGQSLTVGAGKTQGSVVVTGTGSTLTDSNHGSLAIVGPSGSAGSAGSLGGTDGTVTLATLTIGDGVAATKVQMNSAVTVNDAFVVTNGASLDLNANTLTLGTGLTSFQVDGTVSDPLAAAIITVPATVGGLLGTGTMTCAQLHLLAGSGSNGQTTTLGVNTIVNTRATGPNPGVQLEQMHNLRVTALLKFQGNDTADLFASAGGKYSFSSTSTVEFAESASLDVSPNGNVTGNYANVTISGASTYSYNGSKPITGDLVVKGTGTFSLNTATTTVNGNCTVQASSFITGSQTLSIGGNLDDFGTIGNVTFPTLSLTGNCTIEGTGVLSIGGNSSIGGTCTVVSGGTITGNNHTLSITGNLDLAGSMSGVSTLTVSGSSTCLVEGTGSLSLGGNSSIGGSCTVQASGTITGNSHTFTILSGGLDDAGSIGTVTTLAITGDCTIESTGTITPPTSGSITVTGNWTNNSVTGSPAGLVSTNAHTVTLSGSGKLMSGSTTFSSLTIHNAGNATYTTTANQTVNGTLTVGGAAGDKLTINNSTSSTRVTVNSDVTTATTGIIAGTGTFRTVSANFQPNTPANITIANLEFEGEAAGPFAITSGNYGGTNFTFLNSTNSGVSPEYDFSAADLSAANVTVDEAAGSGKTLTVKLLGAGTTAATFKTLTVGGTANTVGGTANVGNAVFAGGATATLSVSNAGAGAITLGGNGSITAPGGALSITAEGITAGANDIATGGGAINLKPASTAFSLTTSGNVNAGAGAITCLDLSTSGATKNVACGVLTCNRDLLINTGATVTVSSNSSVTRNVTFATGGTLAIGTTTFSIGGNWDSSSGTVSVTGSGTLTFTGASSLANGTIKTGGTAQPLPSVHVTKPGASSSYTLQSDVKINGSLTVDTGAVLTDASNTLTLNGGTMFGDTGHLGTISLHNLTTLGTVALNHILTFTGLFTVSSNTTTLGAAIQCGTLSAGGNLDASATTFTVTGDFDNTAVFTAGSTVTVGGHLFTDGGSFTPGTGAVVFNGGGAQHAKFGSNSLHSFTVSNNSQTNPIPSVIVDTGGLTFNGTGTLTGSMQVTGDLSFASGTLTGAGTLTLLDGSLTNANSPSTIGANFVYKIDDVSSRTAAAKSYSGTLQLTSTDNNGTYSFDTTGSANISVTGGVTISGGGTSFVVHTTRTDASTHTLNTGGLAVTSATFTDTFFSSSTISGDLTDSGGNVTLGSGTLTVNGNIAVASVAVASVLDLSGVTTLTFKGNIGADVRAVGTLADLEFKPPATLIAAGTTAQHLNINTTTFPLHNLTVNGLASVALSNDLSLDGNLSVLSGGSFANAASQLTFTGSGKTWNDATITQNFGVVNIATGASITALSPLTVEAFHANGTGAFTFGNFTFTVHDDFSSSAPSTLTPAGTVIFSGNVDSAVTLNGKSLKNVTVSKQATATKVTFTDAVTLSGGGNLDIALGTVIFNANATIGGTTVVEQGQTLTIPDQNAVQTLTFTGQVTVAIGATFSITRTDAVASTSALVTATFQSGLVVDGDTSGSGTTHNGTFTVNATDTTGTTKVKLLFGAGSTSRVGPAGAKSAFPNTTFTLHGNASAASGSVPSAKTVQLISADTAEAGTLPAQWLLTYNLPTDPADPGTQLTDIFVQDSNANAGNIVKAGTTNASSGSSEDGGDNQNWNFGGKHKVTGNIGTNTAGVRVKLFIDQTADTNGKQLTLTTQTDTDGNYSFNLTIAAVGDPFSLFVDDLTKAKAGVVTGEVVSPTASFPTVTLNIKQGYMALVDQRTGGGLPLLTDTILAKVDSRAGSANDPNVSFSVTSGTLTMNNALTLDVNAPLTLASGLTASGAVNVAKNTTIAGTCSAVGDVSVLANATLTLNGSNNTLSGQLLVQSSSASVLLAGSTSVTLATSVGNGSATTGTLTVNAATTLGTVNVNGGGLVTTNASGAITAGTVTVAGGSPAAFGTLTVNASFTAGSLTVNRANSINGAFNANAGTTLTGALNVQGTLTPGSGTQVAVGGSITFGSSASIGSNAWTLLVNGTGGQTLDVGGTLALSALQVAQASGSSNLAATGTGALNVASLTLSSSGTIAFTLNRDLTVTGSGSVLVTGGSLHLNTHNLTTTGTSSGGDVIINGGNITASGTETISVAGNWALVLPGNFVAASSTVVMTGGSTSSPKNITGSIPTNFFMLTIDSASSPFVKLLVDTNVSSLVTVGNPSGSGTDVATLDLGGATLTLSSSSTSVAAISVGASATWAQSTSTVKYTGSVAGTIPINTSAAVDYFNLQILGAATFQPSATPITVIGSLTVDTGTLALQDLQTLNVSAVSPGGVTVQNSGKLRAGTGANTVQIFVDGDWTNKSGGSYVGTTNATVTLEGSASSKLTSGGSTFNNLVVAKVGGASLTAQDNVIASKSLNVTNGTLALGSDDLTVTGATIALSVASSGSITQANANTITVTATTSAAMTVNGAVGAGNLKLNGAGTTTYNGTATLSIASQLNIAAGTLSHASGLIQVNGSSATPFANAGTYSATAGGGALTLASSSGAVTVPTTNSTYNDLTLSSGGYSISGNLTVQGSLAITSGATFSQSTNTVHFTTSNAGTLTSGGQTFGLINVDKNGGTLTLGADLTTVASANGNLLVTAGKLELAGKKLNVGGTLTVNASGVLDDNASTGSDLTVQGATMQVDGTSMTFDLVLPNATSLTGAGTITVNDQVNETSMLSLGAGITLVLNGSNTSPLLFGSLVANASSTVKYRGTAAGTSVKGATYGNLTVNGTGTFLLSADTVAATTFTEDASTFSTGAHTLTVSGATAVVKNASTFNLNGGTLAGDGTTTFNVNDTSTFSGTSSFTVSGITNGVTFAGKTGVSLNTGTINVPSGGTGLVFADRSSLAAPNLSFTSVAFKTGGGTALPTRSTIFNASVTGASPSATYTITFNNAFTGFEYDPANIAVIGNVWGNRFDNDNGTSGANANFDVSQGTIRWDSGSAPQIVSVTTRDTTHVGSINQIDVVFNEPVTNLQATGFTGFAIGSVKGGSSTADNVSVTTIVLASPVTGTELKTVVYSAVGGITNFSGRSLAGVTPPSFDGAGPVIIRAEYDNKNTSSVSDDTLLLTYSEPLNTGAGVFPASASDFAVTGAGFAVGSGTFTNGTNTTLIGQSGGGAPTARGATIKFSGTTVKDPSGNPPDLNNVAAVLIAPIATPQESFFDFVVSVSGATDRSAGEAVQVLVEARNINNPTGTAMAGFTPATGLQIDIFDNAGATNGALGTKPTDFTNFFISSTQGGTFDYSSAAATGTVKISGVTFDANGRYTFTLENTKASKNEASANAQRVRVKVTDVAPSGTGQSGTLPAANSVAWQHATAANLIALLGSATDPDRELLFQGVRPNKHLPIADYAVAVSPTSVPFERTAGVTFTARVFSTDQFFNVTILDAPRNVSVTPFTVTEDPHRLANLQGTDGNPIDTAQGATLIGGTGTAQVKNFLAGLNHQLVPIDLSTSLAVFPSSRYDVYPGEASQLVILLPKQTLDQGVARDVHPIPASEIAFGNSIVAQGNPFVAEVVAVDHHGNWAFNYPDPIPATTNAIVVKTNDTVTGTADMRNNPVLANDNFDKDTVAQRFGLSISADGAGTSVPTGPTNLDLNLTINDQANLTFDLDGRNTGPEIRDLLQSDLQGLAAPAVNQAQTFFFQPFNRYLVRSGAGPTVSVNSRVVAAANGAAQAEVNILRLGTAWTSTGGFGSSVGINIGRGANEFSAPLYTSGATADGDLAQADQTGAPFFDTLKFQHGMAFVSAHSDVQTVSPTANRFVVARLRVPIDPGTGPIKEFFSDGFQVTKGALLVNTVEAFDDSPRDGAIDRIVISFQSSDTIDANAASQLTPSDFKLSFTEGGSTIVRAGASITANPATSVNSLTIIFTPGIPTTSTKNMKIVGPPSVKGLLTSIDLSGGLTNIIDRAPPFPISTSVQTGLMVVTFSEDIEFAAARGAAVSGIFDGTPSVPGGNLTLTVDDNGAPQTTVNFGPSGAPDAASILNAMTAQGLNAAFENNRFVIRSKFASSPSGPNPSLAPRLGGTVTGLGGVAQFDSGHVQSRNATLFDPSTGTIDDLMALSAAGVDLRGGNPFIVGNQLFVPLANQNGDLTPPFFAYVDNFTQNFIQDLAGTPNFLNAALSPTSGLLRGSGVFSTIVGLETQNVAVSSGFLRAREQDNLPGDGIFENVPPGFFETDLALSPLPAALISKIELTGITGPVQPTVIFPTPITFPFNFGNNLAHTQVGLMLLTPGNYTISYQVTLTGTLPIGLAVNASNQLRRTFTAQVLNVRAVAHVPDGPIVVAVNKSVSLDGSLSVDPNGGAIANFAWTEVSGPAATITGANTAIASVQPSTPGVYVFQLKVDKGSSATAGTAQVTVVAQSTTDSVPTADAGLDQVVLAGQAGVRLDGGVSVSPQGRTLGFTWSQAAGPTVSLVVDPAHPAIATFTAPNAAAFLKFQLVVNDGVRSSPFATVGVVVSDESGTSGRPPFASFDVSATGSDTRPSVPFLFGHVNQRLELTAAASQGQPRVAKFDWTQLSGATVTLAPSGNTMSFVPALPGTYRIELAGENGQGVTGRPTDLDVRIVATAAAPPVVSIAPLSATTVEVGTTVSLAASSSVTGPRVTWRQTAGPLTAVGDANALSTSVVPASAGVYTYEVTIDDPATSATDHASVTFGVNNSAANDKLPIASFQGVTGNLQAGQVVSLSSSGSSDPNSPPGALTASFIEIVGLPSFLTGSTTGALGQSFDTAQAGTYSFELIVSNGKHRSLPATQAFEVTGTAPVGQPVTHHGGGGGGCSIAAAAPAGGAGTGALLPLAALVIGLALLRGARREKVRIPLRKATSFAVLALLATLGSGCASGLIGALIGLTGGSNSKTPHVTAPELVLTSVDAPSVAMAVDSGASQTVIFQGNSGDLVANVLNQGDEATTGTFKVDWFLSRTKTIDATAFKVRSLDVSPTGGVPIGGAHRAVSAGGTEAAVVPVKAGTHLDAGRYFLIGRVNNPNTLTISEHDNSNNVDVNNDFLGSTVVEVYKAVAPLPAATSTTPDLTITRLDVTTAALMNATMTANIYVTNLIAPIGTNTTVAYTVLISTNESLTGATVAGNGAFTLTPTAIETPVRATVVFKADSTKLSPGSYLVAVSLTATDADPDNNFRVASIPTTFYTTNVIFDNGANLPLTAVGDPTLLDITRARPPVATSLVAGQQRTLAFQLPDTGVNPLVTQALITVQSTDFDPVVELISPAGSSIQVLDDFHGGRRAVLYSTLTAARQNRTFFLVVSGASAAAGGSFTVSLDVNSEQLGDDEPVLAHDLGDILDHAPADLDAAGEIAIPFTFSGLENEFLFQIPAAGRFPLALRAAGTNALDDQFLDPTRTTLISFDEGGNPTVLPFVVARRPRDPAVATSRDTLLLQSLESDGLFSLTPGAYVLIVRAQFLPFFLDQQFQLVFEKGLLFKSGVTLSGR